MRWAQSDVAALLIISKFWRAFGGKTTIQFERRQTDRKCNIYFIIISRWDVFGDADVALVTMTKRTWRNRKAQSINHVANTHTPFRMYVFRSNKRWGGGQQITTNKYVAVSVLFYKYTLFCHIY